MLPKLNVTKIYLYDKGNCAIFTFSLPFATTETSYQTALSKSLTCWLDSIIIANC